MDSKNPQDHQKLLSEVIKKQIVILGPDITLAKARNVPGLTVADDGSVTAISGNPAEVTQKLVEQFMELSGMIVKKTMEPLLAGLPDGVATAATAGATQSAQTNSQTTPAVQAPASPLANQGGPTNAAPPISQPAQSVQPQQPQPTAPVPPAQPIQTNPSGEAGSRSAGQPAQQPNLTTEQNGK